MLERKKKPAMPKKPWRKGPTPVKGKEALKKGVSKVELLKKAKEQDEYVAAQELLKAAGGHGKDSRSPSLAVEKNGVNAQLMKNNLSSIRVTAQARYTAVQWMCIAPISLAIQRGWLSNDTSLPSLPGNQAYQAYGYLLNAFYNSMNGTFPALQTAPMWFWEICAALTPTSTRFKTGSIQYTWDITTAAPTFRNDYGGYTYYFGVPTGTFVNGFPELADPSAYDPVQGEAAIGSLFQFMNGEGMSKLTPKPDFLQLMQDPSAFASSYVEWGSSPTEVGGVATTLQSEVKIQCPIMSKFAQYQQNDDRWRGFQEARKGAGTSSYIIPRVLEFKSAREFRNKASPVFKAYNFDEYFLTLSFILASALEKLGPDNSTATVTSCPLTSLQVQIVLRQSIIGRFYNIYAQDLLFSQYLGGDTLVPFSMGPNGASTNATQGMLLPFVFLENIRSATRRTINVGAKGTDYVVDAIPVLTRPDQKPMLGNFTYKDRNGVDQLLYFSSSTEVPINIIDLSYNNKMNFITATGKALTDLIVSWNGWIKTLGNALSTLGTIGEEPGISALITTFNTRHCNFIGQGFVQSPPVPGPPQITKKNSMSKVVRKGLEPPSREKVNLPAPVPGESDQYSSYAVLRLTSSDPFYSSLWRYTSSFVQPVTFADYKSVYDSTLAFQQVFQVEPYSISYADIPMSLGLDPSSTVSLEQLCLASAVLDIKTNLSSPSEAEIELSKLAEMGRGGFFTSLAGLIGEGLGVSGAKEVANLVGSFTGL